MFESGNQPEINNQDEELIMQAYGYSLGEVVKYRGLVDVKIIEFGHNFVMKVRPIDPDSRQLGEIMTISANECE